MPSLNTRETSTPTPSNTLRRIPQATAEPSADLGPPRRNRSDVSSNHIRHIQHSRRVDVRGLTPCSETSTSQETTDNCIPHVLFLSNALYCTVECGEHATPNAEVAACDGGTGFDNGHCTDEAIALCVWIQERVGESRRVLTRVKANVRRVSAG